MDISDLPAFTRKKDKVDVTILNVIDPAHYVIKESRSVFYRSDEANAFLELEQVINEYFQTVQQPFPYIPVGKKIFVVRLEKNERFCRARLINIFNTMIGPKIRVYLVDYGEECTVTKDRVYEIPNRFPAKILQVPYQAVNFRLVGIKPLTLAADPNDCCTMLPRPSEEWDEAAVQFVKNICKETRSVQAEVLYCNENCAFGFLHIEHASEVVIMNKLLENEKFAYLSESFIEDLRIANSRPCSRTRSFSICSDSSSFSEKSSNNFSISSKDIGTTQKEAIKAGSRYSSMQEKEEIEKDEIESPSKKSESKIVHSSDEKTIETVHNFIPNEKCTISSIQKSPDSPKLSSSLLNTTTSNSSSFDNLQEDCVECKNQEKSTVTYKSLYKSAVFKKHEDSSNHSQPISRIVDNVCQKTQPVSVTDVHKDISNGKNQSSGKSFEPIVNQLENADSCDTDSTHSVSSSKHAESKSSPEFKMLYKKAVMRKQSKDLETSPKVLRSSDNVDANIKETTKLTEIRSIDAHATGNISDHFNSNMTTCSSPKSVCSEISNVSLDSISETSSIRTVKRLLKNLKTQKSMNSNEKDFVQAQSSTCDLPSDASNVDNVSCLSSKNDCDSVDGSSFVPNVEQLQDRAQVLQEVDSCLKSLDERKKQNYTLERYLRNISEAQNDDYDDDSDENIQDNKKQIDRLKYFSKNRKESYAALEENISRDYEFSLDFTGKSLFEKQGIAAVRIGISPPAPILYTDEAYFAAELKKKLLELNFHGPTCIQSGIWPAMLRCRSFIGISPKHSGKTISYLLHLLSNIINGADYVGLESGNGPLAVILCSSWKVARNINEQAATFLDSCRKVSVVMLSDVKDNVHGKEAELLRGCDLIIATPSCLLYHLEKGSTNFRRVCHFFIDDGNDVIKYHNEKLAKVMKELLNGLRMQKTHCQPFQIGICAERWTKGISAFRKMFMTEELLIFTSYLEAAIYVKMPIYVNFCEESSKMIILPELLDSIKSTKTVICVQNEETAVDVHQDLMNLGVYCLIVHENIPHYELDVKKRQWFGPHSENSPAIMVISDPAMISMNVSDATALIHYDLPETSRLQFSYRFSCISDSISSLGNNSDNVMRGVCHVLFTETCKTQASSFVSILQRSKNDVPIALKQKATEQKLDKKSTAAESKLCHYIKAYGSCVQPGCQERHCIDVGLDQPNSVPNQGDITAIVSYVFDATHYAVKILSYVDPVTNSSVSRTGDYAKLSIELQDYYSCLKNHIRSRYPVVGKLNAMKEKDGIFHRVKVLEIVNEFDANVFFVDEGWVKKCSRDYLFTLHERFQEQPPFAVEVYLCNVKPSDPCFDWSPSVNRFIYDLIGGQKIHGKIVLCLGNTLFLRPVVMKDSQLSFVGSLNIVEIGEILKHHKYAISNQKHLTLLQKACEGKITLPFMTKSQKESESKPQVNWAFLDIGNVEDVYIPYIESPQRLYVQRAKTCDSLDKLVMEITKKVKAKELKPLSSVKNGSYCVAEIPDSNMFYRGKVVEIIEKNGTQMAHVHFVDYGDFIEANVNDLYALPKELMLFPFQAIECELAGITPPHGGWADVATEDMLNITRDDLNCMKMLKVKAWEKVASFFGGNRYIVDAFDSDFNLSEYLVKHGYADSTRTGNDLLKELNMKTPNSVSDELHQLSSDDSSPIEHKNASALMCGVLAVMQTMGCKENLLSYQSTMKQNEVQKTNNVLAPHNETVSSPIVTNASACNIVNTECKSLSLKPAITWWNTNDDVTVTINLLGIKRYELEISDTGFSFSTIIQAKIYALEERLYADIVNELAEVTCYGHGLRMKFVKKVPVKWPRLISADVKAHHIKRDFDHLSDSESENRIVQEKVSLNVKTPEDDVLPHDEEDREFDSSDSGGEEYVAEPWTQICENNRSDVLKYST